MDRLYGQVAGRSGLRAPCSKNSIAAKPSYFSIPRFPPAAAIFPGSRESSNTTSTPHARSTVCILNGTTSRCPDIRFIFSHAGGALPVLAARINDDFPKRLADRVPHGVDYEVRRLYFETAHASKAPALDALKDIVPVSQILYGSDVPLRKYPLTDEGLEV